MANMFAIIDHYGQNQIRMDKPDAFYFRHYGNSKYSVKETEAFILANICLPYHISDKLTIDHISDKLTIDHNSDKLTIDRVFRL